ncbi:probable polygalacturonase At3g15720 [Impatiens glandulifera]|uniref:probable polygalacturonase At3g15720 n=1 Tax=Impatiens glandulifera TaxID=253017 RepID=UPI001FB12B07|nr:probable polygalacturonase At3g15720 [Impatiens glandulifera]
MNLINPNLKAFLQAWGKACESSSISTMLVPGGKTYLLIPIQFKGPCKGPSIQVQIDGILLAPSIRSQWKDCPDNTWIAFSQIIGLHINGKGKLNGQGLSWWKTNPRNNYNQWNQKESPCTKSTSFCSKASTILGACAKPTGIRFIGCNNLVLSGLTHINPPSRHINIYGCQNVQISHLTITAPANSPNTDGIGISSSSNVRITDSFIGTGDDCVAISTGSTNIFVGGVQCGPGHGISVGSLGQGGSSSNVDGVFVQNCTFTGTENGVRIKTWPGGKGYARNITFTGIRLNNVKNSIIIDQTYCQVAENCQDQAQAVQVSDVKYIGVQGTSATPQAIVLQCSHHVPCKNIIFNRINITSSSKGNALASCKNAVVSIQTAISPNVSCISAI